MKRTAITLAAITMLIALSACSKPEEPSSSVSFKSAAPVPATTETSQQPAAPASMPADANVARSAAGSDLVSIVLSPDPRIEIVESGATSTLISNSKDTGKRKYYDANGTQVAEVKPSDTGFKVRTPDGKLLWKVRLGEGKIKVSDNEENANPWVLKTDYPDKAKVLSPTESEVGDVRFASAPSPTRVRTSAGSDAWTIEPGKASAAWGVLLMDSVPHNYQGIIIAELLSRGL